MGYNLLCKTDAIQCRSQLCRILICAFERLDRSTQTEMPISLARETSDCVALGNDFHNVYIKVLDCGTK